MADALCQSMERVADRQQLLTRGLPIVRRVSRRVARRVPSSVEFDDLVGAGTEGLLRAIDAYDPTKCPRFEPYAEARIRGAILDELRAGDVMTQHGRRRLAVFRRVSAALEQALGRPASDEEVADAARTTVAAYREAVWQASQASAIASSAAGDPDAFESVGPDPSMVYAQAEERRRLAIAVATLPEKLQETLSLYYEHGCTQSEIGRVLGVTESRVCQLLAEAIGRLRFSLRERAVAAPARRR